jgi:hypothetical protein
MLRSLKIVGALLVLVSLALPMSSCRHYVDAKGERLEVEKGEPPPPGAQEVVSYHYALESFNARELASWTNLLVFVWPGVMLGAQFWRRRGRMLVVLRVLEILLLIYSFFIVDLMATLFADRIEAGAYLAFTGFGLYAVAALWEDATAFRRWRRARALREAAPLREERR